MTPMPVVAELEESRRSALVAYHLGHMDDVNAYKVTTAEDLYEYLLFDPMVTAAVDASDVTMAVASLQQYVNAIGAGMEPGYAGLTTPDERRVWRDRRGQYALWAGNQMLQNYPENYLDPTLRLKKTVAFGEFVNTTSQGRITKESVQLALVQYLETFEAIANLKVLAGYCDREDIRNADYYFLGKANVEPSKYYWRKLEVRLGDEATPGAEEQPSRIPATAWNEWESIDLPTGGEVVAIRPVYFNSRICVAWLEHSTSQKVNEADLQLPAKTEHAWTFRLTWRTQTGGWAVPMSWKTRPFPSWKADSIIQFASFAWNDVEGERQLVLAAHPDGDADGACFICLDEMLDVSTSSERSDDDVVKTTVEATVKAYGAFAKSVQVPPTRNGNLRWVESDTREGPEGALLHMQLSPFMSFLNAGKGAVYARGGHAGLIFSGARLELSLTYKGASTENFAFPETRSPHFLIGLSTPPYLRHLKSKFLEHDEVSSVLTYTRGVQVSALTSNRKLEVVATATKTPQIVTSADGGQFLDIDILHLEQSHVRLTTWFGKYLVDRASRSLDALLDWDTQHVEESQLPEDARNVSTIMDFDGANGRYFWELFFHVPHAVAWRLRQEFNYRDAEDWLHYIFNPQARAKSSGLEPPAYWSVRPLTGEGEASHEVAGPVDPDAICYTSPVHYRKAIFVLYVRNLIAMGDELFRRLTRDSLNEAKLCYIRALSLIGPKPDYRMLARWEPVALHEAASYTSESLAVLDASETNAMARVAPNAADAPWLDLLDTSQFRTPLNTMLLAVWDELDLRLSNLRHHLTIDGKPIMIPLYDAPANPMDLLRAQSAGGGMFQRGIGGLAAIPPYRFRAMLPRAQDAVATLIRFGDDVRSYRESKDRAHQEELQQKHLQELSAFGVAMSSVLLDQANANVVALEASRKLVLRRKALTVEMQNSWIIGLEGAAAAAGMTAKVIRAPVTGAFAASGVVAAASTIVTAFGGGPTQLSETVGKAAQSVSVVADMVEIGSDLMSRSAELLWRDEQWKHDIELADVEVAAIDKQIDALRISIDYSTQQLAQARKAQAQAEEHYTFLKTRSTNEGLYSWLVSQMSTLYFQAYDAVVALCLSAEAAWQYETGDDESRFIQPDVWFDNYHGLTAGASLKLQLMRMEAAHLKRHERRLELVRTISLKELFDKWPSAAAGLTGDAAIAELVSKGKLQFKLPQAMFDHDYPGHYLRQIVSVSVSLPLVVGAYQDVKATLTQVSSTTMLKADLNAARFLYGAEGGVDAGFRRNLRVSQSIGLSHGVDDAGMHVVNFYDERYLPFEGTGAVSTWELKFPRHDKSPQKEMLATLNDVILRISYTAVDGGPQFAEAVEALVDEAMKPPKPSDP